MPKRCCARGNRGAKHVLLAITLTLTAITVLALLGAAIAAHTINQGDQ